MIAEGVPAWQALLLYIVPVVVILYLALSELVTVINWRQGRRKRTCTHTRLSYRREYRAGVYGAFCWDCYAHVPVEPAVGDHLTVVGDNLNEIENNFRDLGEAMERLNLQIQRLDDLLALPPEARLPLEPRAHDKARDLLLSHLSLEQRVSFDLHGWFRVVGQRFDYIITYGRSGNVHKLPHGAEPVRGRIVALPSNFSLFTWYRDKDERLYSIPWIKLCAYPSHPSPYFEPLSNFDVMLAQKLTLEANEREFLTVAFPSAWDFRPAPVPPRGVAFWTTQ